MEAILALILAGTIARTGGMWAVTRLAAIATVVFAIFLDFTQLRGALGPSARWVWIGMLVLWVANLIVPRRSEA
jgi:quinol-cytochrome oxidoreductase complex cytochrome b subunit